MSEFPEGLVLGSVLFTSLLATWIKFADDTKMCAFDFFMLNWKQNILVTK